MLSYIEALILGILEGITEFLPVSSTGHLILASHFMGHEDNAFVDTFNIFIQSGAILAVVLHFKTKISKLLQELDIPSIIKNKEKNSGTRLALNIIIAFIPAAILGFFFHKTIKTLLFSPLVVAISLIIGAVILFIVEYFTSKKVSQATYTLETLPHSKALFIGFAQCFAMIPGTSRSLSTILGGKLTGLNTKDAADFSFLLAIPTIFAATAYDLLKSFMNKTLSLSDAHSIYILGFGFLVSFIVSLVVIKFFFSLLKKYSLNVYGVYRIILAIFIIVLLLR